MTRKVAEKIVRGITDKIECNTVDIDDWAEFWGFTREEYEEFLDMRIKALEQEPRKGHWLRRPHVYGVAYCSICDFELKIDNTNYCPNCGAKMESEE